MCEEKLSVESESHLKITQKIQPVIMNEEIQPPGYGAGSRTKLLA